MFHITTPNTMSTSVLTFYSFGTSLTNTFHLQTRRLTGERCIKYQNTGHLVMLLTENGSHNIVEQVKGAVCKV